MEYEKLQKLAANCLFGMAVNNKLNDDSHMNLLNGIVFLMKNSGIIKASQEDDFILLFYQEYNNGTGGNPMSLDYIKNSILPAVKNAMPIDIREASDFLDLALDTMDKY